MSNKKIFRNTIILLAVVAVLAVAMVAVMKYDPDKKEPEASDSSRITLISLDSAAITRVDITNPEDGDYALVKQEDIWKLEGQPEVELNQSKVSTLISDSVLVTADKVIDENPSDLTVYGLSPVTRKITLTPSEGEAVTLLIGSGGAGNTIRYVQLMGDPKVYSVYYSKGEAITPRLSSIKDTQIYSVTADSARSVVIKRAGMADIVLEAVVSTDDNGAETVGSWKMTAPYAGKDTDSEEITKQITPYLSTMSATKIIAEQPADLSQYGLAQPRGSIAITDKDNVTVTMLVGSQFQENDAELVYVKRADSGRVYSLPAANASFLKIEAHNLIMKFIHLQNIEQVSEVKVSGAGQEYTMSISGDEENPSYQINDRTVAESDFKKAYQAAIGVTFNRPIEGQPSGSAEYTVVYNRKDGTAVTVQYISAGDREYAAVVDGVCEFVVLKKDVTAILEAVTNAYNAAK